VVLLLLSSQSKSKVSKMKKKIKERSSYRAMLTQSSPPRPAHHARILRTRRTLTLLTTAPC
jgi:hypothetical protein